MKYFNVFICFYSRKVLTARSVSRLLPHSIFKLLLWFIKQYKKRFI